MILYNMYQNVRFYRPIIETMNSTGMGIHNLSLELSQQNAPAASSIPTRLSLCLATGLAPVTANLFHPFTTHNKEMVCTNN